jgi:hypothetical protein
MGHYLGLFHPFEDGCAGSDSSDCATKGDLCCDVSPVASGIPGNCGPANTCNETPTDLPDQKENHMDYALETCRTKFTPNQADIMYAVLEGVRSNLWQPQNINNLQLACCVNAIAFGGQTDVCKGKGDSINMVAYQYDSANYVWKIYKNDSLYTTINKGYSHQISVLPDTGLYDVVLEITRNGIMVDRLITKAFEVLNCDSLLPSTQGSWYFGQYAGMRFFKNGVVLRDIEPWKNSPIFTLGQNQINAAEGTLSMCDSMGNLLFYGGGEDNYGYRNTVFRIYDRNYKEVSQSPIYGHTSSSQGGVTFKVPGSKNRFYIITVWGGESSMGYAKYSVFDVNLNTGGTQGDIDSNFKDIILLDSFGNDLDADEMITAIPSCNGLNYWVITTHYFGVIGPKLMVYLADSNGITFHNSIFIGNYTDLGQLKVSPDGNFIAMQNKIYKFNRCNGEITLLSSDPEIEPGQIYGLTFSPNSKYLYRLEKPFLFKYDANLTQLDLSYKTIHSSKINISQVDSYFKSFQNGPDGKIYISLVNQNYLSAISTPNNRNTVGGNECGLIEEAVLLNRNGIGGICHGGLPNQIDALPVSSLPKDFSYRSLGCDSIQFWPTNCCSNNFRWIFGEDTLNEYSPLYKFSEKGTFEVKLVLDNDTIIKNITIGIDSSLLQLSGPSSVCDSVIPKLYSGVFNADITYNWKITNGNALAIDAHQAEIIWANNGSTKLYLFNNRTQCYDSVEKNVEFYEPTVLNDSIFQSQSACNLSKLDTITGTNYANNIYLWMQKINSQNWVPLSNSNSADYKPTILDSNIYYYRIAVNSTTCTNYISNIIVVSKGDSLFDTIQQNQYLCRNTIMDTIKGIPYSNVTYKWYSIDAGQTQWVLDSNNANYYYFKTNIDTTFYIKRVAINNEGCDYFSNIIKVIYEKPVNMVSANSPSSAFCYYGANGSEPAIIVNDIQYKWYVSYDIGGALPHYLPYTHSINDTLINLQLPHNSSRSIQKFQSYRILQYNSCFDTSNVVVTNQRNIRRHPENSNFCNHPWGYDYLKGHIDINGGGNILWQQKNTTTNIWNTISDTTYGSQDFSYKYYLGSNIKGDSVRFIWIDNIGSCADTQYSKSAVIKTDSVQPVIQTIFTDVTVDEFVTVMYGVSATNSANAVYNWQVKAQGTNYWSPLNNNSSSFNIFPVEFCQNGNSYRVIVSNACGSDTSNTSLLTVNQIIMSLWYDVWMKDNPNDTAAEPNTFVDPNNITLDVYRSPDIWNCKDNSSCTNHENAEFKTNTPNYAQVKVRNKGPNQSAYDNLRVYWTYCSTGEIWDESWIGTDKNRFWNADSGKYYPLGGQITSNNGYQIANLDANDSVTVSFAWYPPNPKWYYTTVGGVKTYETSSCVCLLARLEQCNNYPFGLTYPEKFGLKIQDNVIKNNNIITKNIAVLDDISSDFKVKSEWTGIGRLKNNCDSFLIQIKPENSTFFDHWIVEVVLEDTLKDLWWAGGAMGSGFEIIDTNRLRVDDTEPFYISNICLDKEQLAFVKLEFTAIDTQQNIPIETFDIAIWQAEADLGPESYQGGFVYRIDNSSNQLNSSGYSYKRKISDNNEKKEINYPLNWRFYPNPTEKNLVVEFNSNFEGLASIQIFNVYGKLIIDQKAEMHKGENKSNLDLLSVASGTYFIKLTTNELAKSNKFFIQK